jgi:hypothetical protein
VLQDRSIAEGAANWDVRPAVKGVDGIGAWAGPLVVPRDHDGKQIDLSLVSHSVKLTKSGRIVHVGVHIRIQDNSHSRFRRCTRLRRSAWRRSHEG